MRDFFLQNRHILKIKTHTHTHTRTTFSLVSSHSKAIRAMGNYSQNPQEKRVGKA